MRQATALRDWVATIKGDVSSVALAGDFNSYTQEDPLEALRVAGFVEQQRAYENTSAVLLGAACSAWDVRGRAARQVLEALQATGVPLMRTMVPLSRRVPSSTLDKFPVVLGSPTSPVGSAYRTLADEVCSTAERMLS